MGITVFFWYAFAGIPLHLAVAAQLKLSAGETASWVLIFLLTSAASSIGVSLFYRIPMPITWTIPGIIYLGALAGRFSYAEIVGANLLAGLLMVAMGALGIGKRIMTWLPFAVVMGMFSGSPRVWKPPSVRHSGGRRCRGYLRPVLPRRACCE